MWERMKNHLSVFIASVRIQVSCTARYEWNSKHRWSAQLFLMINSFFSSSFWTMFVCSFFIWLLEHLLFLLCILWKKKCRKEKNRICFLSMMCACAGNVLFSFFASLSRIENVIFKYINVQLAHICIEPNTQKKIYKYMRYIWISFQNLYFFFSWIAR